MTDTRFFQMLYIVTLMVGGYLYWQTWEGPFTALGIAFIIGLVLRGLFK